MKAFGKSLAALEFFNALSRTDAVPAINTTRNGQKENCPESEKGVCVNESWANVLKIAGMVMNFFR